MQQDPNDVSQNRANQLLFDLLRNRYPHLMSSETEKRLRSYLALSSEAALQSWMMQHQERSQAQAVIESFSSERANWDATDLGKDLDDEIKLNVLLYLGI